MAMPQTMLLAVDSEATGERIDELCRMSHVRTNVEIAELLDSAEFHVDNFKVGHWRKGKSLVPGVIQVLAYGLAGMGSVHRNPDVVMLYLLRGGPKPFDPSLVGASDEAIDSTAKGSDIPRTLNSLEGIAA